jgi:hypothetical protein
MTIMKPLHTNPDKKLHDMSSRQLMVRAGLALIFERDTDRAIQAAEGCLEIVRARRAPAEFRSVRVLPGGRRDE